MKLFVLIRRDLPLEHQAVQAGHAVAQWCLARGRAGWEGTLVYLHVPDELELKIHAQILEEKAEPFELFREPDLDNAATALATCHWSAPGRYKKLPLMRA